MREPRNNHLYCERHKGWFFSRKYAESGELPTQCPLCKRTDWGKKVLKSQQKKGE